MPRQLARLFGFPACRERSRGREAAPAMNEVSEHEGVLLVRLGRGSAMQVRFEPPVDAGAAQSWFRIVPIAKARQLSGDAPWHAASEAQLQAWVDSGSAVGRWLLSKGLDCARSAVAAAGGILPLSVL